MSGVRRTYRDGETILLQGAPATSVRVLVSGRVEVGCQDEDGAYCLVALRGTGDVVGELAAQNLGTRSATVTALEPCVAHTVPAATFHGVLARHGVDAQLRRYLAGKLQESVGAAVDTVHHPPRQRLARLIVRLVELADPGHPDPLRVPMSQTRLALALGLSRSSVARLVSAMRADGLLGKDRRLRVERPGELRDLARQSARLTPRM
ncbi:Crp/Fnr family transcriptional regulator [Amycolatopsis anabasis]|uniref:Crp/Fnr family transcriptional regulator n=1 Tax=Amycolatopsis anabasis TaxID=1840409 RepID=UPI00131B4611|nr:Crp/Fnr family transcriptional regulator [Amycolatopsis anabasis]